MIKMCEGRYLFCNEYPLCNGLDSTLGFSEDESEETQIEYCICDKTGQYFYVGGLCDDAFGCDSAENTQGFRKTGRAYRRKMRFSKTDRRLGISKYSTFGRCGYISDRCVNGEWIPGNHLKYPSHSRRQSFFKKYSNKKIRKYEGDIKSGNHYRRLFDYKWNID